MIAKTSCQQCGQHIEFELENAGEFVPCPSCGQQTRLLVATSKPSAASTAEPAAISKPSHGRKKLLLAGVVVASLAACVFAVGLYYQQHRRAVVAREFERIMASRPSFQDYIDAAEKAGDATRRLAREEAAQKDRDVETLAEKSDRAVEAIRRRSAAGIAPEPTPEEIAAAKKAVEAAKAAQEKAKDAAKLKAEQQKKYAAAAALKFNQDAAAKGDIVGLLRMGERYRDGDGVEKDLAKAKEYLQKAADAGSPTAKEELLKLNQP